MCKMCVQWIASGVTERRSFRRSMPSGKGDDVDGTDAENWYNPWNHRQTGAPVGSCPSGTRASHICTHLWVAHLVPGDMAVSTLQMAIRHGNNWCGIPGIWPSHAEEDFKVKKRHYVKPHIQFYIQIGDSCRFVTRLGFLKMVICIEDIHVRPVKY